MKCPSCGFENESGVKFCGNCGRPLQNTCPSCGTVNAAGARFCASCGHALGAAPPAVSTQPVMVVKQGTSGWVWALVGILLGVIVIGGLGLGGILPLDFLQKPEPTSPPIVPTAKPVIASTKTPTASASVELYCPQEGGVILYWNAGYDCNSELGDPGYRQRLGDGNQNLNTGEFDNQASAIIIPPGWSVRLYENPDRGGASVCLNSSVPNFEERGNFPDKAIPINDNVSSMRVSRDGTCGADLAAGAEPAPLPKKDQEILAPGQGECNDTTPCGCLPGILSAFQAEGDIFVDPVAFGKQYIDWFEQAPDMTQVWFKPEFDELYEALKAANLKIFIGADWVKDGVLDGGAFEPECFNDADRDGLLTCKANPREGAEFTIKDWGIHIGYESPTVFSWCAVAQYNEETEDAVFNFAAPQPVSQCTNPKKPQVCGDLCCSKDDKCVQRRGVWRCDKASGPSKQCESWDSCCLNPSLPGCP